MSRPPWFPLYPNDYDNDTADLSLEEDGFYSRCLRRAWSKSDDGCSLPTDRARLSRVLNLPIKSISKFDHLLLRYFVIDGDHLVSNRLKEESRKAELRSKTARAKGKLGGRPKQSSGLSPAESPVEAGALSEKAGASSRLKPRESDSQSQEEESKDQTRPAVGVGTGSSPDLVPNGGPARNPTPVGRSFASHLSEPTEHPRSQAEIDRDAAEFERARSKAVGGAA